MDPAMFNMAGPSNYHIPQDDAQLARKNTPAQSQTSIYHQSYSSAQPSFASSSASPTSQAPALDDRSDRPTTSGNGHAGQYSNGGPFIEPHQNLEEFLESFWTRHMDIVEREELDGKVNVSLPLARIKKVMKSDEEVKMISAEVPILFSKACEVFISELTCRAWLVAESHKRRTLQKSDVAAAIAHSDMFDFLIDIVPRDGGSGDGDASKAQSGSDGEGAEEDDVYRAYVEGAD